jgi:HlyD family secretion protein
MFMNPDLKVFNSDIYLESNGVELRTGMSCKAEIIIDEYEDVVHVPVESVIQVGGKSTVYVVKGKSYGSREVEIGLDDNRRVHIKKGLDEGERVLLAPPLAAGEIETVATKIPAQPAAPSKKVSRTTPDDPHRTGEKGGPAR